MKCSSMLLTDYSNTLKLNSQIAVNVCFVYVNVNLITAGNKCTEKLIHRATTVLKQNALNAEQYYALS